MSRRPLDFYETHEALTTTLFERLPQPILGKTVFEPCAGDLAIARVAKQHGAMIVQTNDIDEARPTEYHFDARSLDGWVGALGGVQYDYVITNPPFNAAAEILPHAWRYAGIGLAALLRLTYLEPTKKRAEWLRHMSPYLSRLIIFSQPRPAFALNKHGKPGTDSVTTAWYVWTKRHALDQGTRVYFETGWNRQ